MDTRAINSRFKINICCWNVEMDHQQATTNSRLELAGGFVCLSVGLGVFGASGGVCSPLAGIPMALGVTGIANAYNIECTGRAAALNLFQTVPHGPIDQVMDISVDPTTPTSIESTPLSPAYS